MSSRSQGQVQQITLIACDSLDDGFLAFEAVGATVKVALRVGFVASVVAIGTFYGLLTDFALHSLSAVVWIAHPGLNFHGKHVSVVTRFTNDNFLLALEARRAAVEVAASLSLRT